MFCHKFHWTRTNGDRSILSCPNSPRPTMRGKKIQIQFDKSLVIQTCTNVTLGNKMNSEDAGSFTCQTHYTNSVSSGAEQVTTRNTRTREEITTNRAKYVKRKEGRGPYLGAWQYLLITTLS